VWRNTRLLNAERFYHKLKSDGIIKAKGNNFKQCPRNGANGDDKTFGDICSVLAK
jgi:hypothetical protein